MRKKSITFDLIQHKTTGLHLFTFVSSLLRQLDVVGVGLEYSHSPPTGPLRLRAVGGWLAEPGNLGSGSGRTAVSGPGLYACDKNQEWLFFKYKKRFSDVFFFFIEKKNKQTTMCFLSFIWKFDKNTNKGRQETGVSPPGLVLRWLGTAALILSEDDWESVN